MEVMTKEPFAVLEKIKNAGEILLGEYTPVTLCPFVLGPNAILPTGGFAKTYSSVSVMDFLKRSSVGYATKEGFQRVRAVSYTHLHRRNVAASQGVMRAFTSAWPKWACLFSLKGMCAKKDEQTKLVPMWESKTIRYSALKTHNRKKLLATSVR